MTWIRGTCSLVRPVWFRVPPTRGALSFKPVSPSSEPLPPRLQIQNVGVGHTRVVYFARTHRVAAFVARSACSPHVHAALSRVLSPAALLGRGKNRRGPLLQPPLRHAWQCLARASSNQRHNRLLVICIEAAGAKCVAHLLRQCAVCG